MKIRVLWNKKIPYVPELISLETIVLRPWQQTVLDCINEDNYDVIINRYIEWAYIATGK